MECPYAHGRAGSDRSTGIGGGGGSTVKRVRGDTGRREELSRNKMGRGLRAPAELTRATRGAGHQGRPNAEAGGDGRRVARLG